MRRKEDLQDALRGGGNTRAPLDILRRRGSSKPSTASPHGAVLVTKKSRWCVCVRLLSGLA
ncbi:hypothetical protein E2C01_072300 [Portunus trituberculatus]|uniref:Uncharacterized protein n=1 Tax=Portunus trituberculatus TaxID=210409 RepID=A0A5B7I292_PORTR|nr:hypothetical protein [Portunus trituberculatus]